MENGRVKCQAPYLLLLARSMLIHALARPTQNKGWTHSVGSEESDVAFQSVPPEFSEGQRNLKAIHLWNARAAVARVRLLQTRDSSVTLWNEAKESFQSTLSHFCDTVDMTDDNWDERRQAATVVLEWGLAHHYSNRADQGKLYFHKVMEYSGLHVEVAGAVPNQVSTGVQSTNGSESNTSKSRSMSQWKQKES